MNETPKERGMSLIEVMIAMTILAIGLLGLAYLQANAAQYFGTAAVNSNAAFLSNAMLANIWGVAVLTSAVLTTWTRPIRPPGRKPEFPHGRCPPGPATYKAPFLAAKGPSRY